MVETLKIALGFVCNHHRLGLQSLKIFKTEEQEGLFMTRNAEEFEYICLNPAHQADHLSSSSNYVWSAINGLTLIKNLTAEDSSFLDKCLV